MRITLTPLATYAARLLVLMLGAVVMFGRIDLLTFGFAILFALVIGGLVYWADFRAREEAGEIATVEPLCALGAWPFWVKLALTTLIYGLSRVWASTWPPSPVAWIGGILLIGIAGEGLRAFGFRRIRRSTRF